MINLNFVNEWEKQFIQFKHALRVLIRAAVQKGMDRMYPFIFNRKVNKEILSEILKTNLNDNQFQMIESLLSSFIKPINDIVQEFIDAEVKSFRNEHPEAELKEVAQYRRETRLGTLNLKVPRFRNAEFKSIIIRSKCRHFFTETLLLASIVSSGLMSYEGIQTFFNNFGINMTNQEIANITKVVDSYKSEIINNHNKSIHSHQ